MITLRKMNESDLDDVYDIEKRCFNVPWSRNMFANELACTARNVMIIACIDDKVIGYIGLTQLADEGHITTVAVDEPYRRQGIASRLLLAVATEARRRKLDTLTLEVRVGNISAQGFYRKFGFKVMGLRKNYYPEAGEDALIMTKKGIKDLLERSRCDE